MNLLFFLRMKIWILVIEICLEIEDVYKFDSLEAWKGKNKETSQGMR